MIAETYCEVIWVFFGQMDSNPHKFQSEASRRPDSWVLEPEFLTVTQVIFNEIVLVGHLAEVHWLDWSPPEPI